MHAVEGRTLKIYSRSLIDATALHSPATKAEANVYFAKPQIPMLLLIQGAQTYVKLCTSPICLENQLECTA